MWKRNNAAVGKVKWLWEQNNPKRWFFHPLKKGRKVIYLFVRTFRGRKAVRNHLVNKQSKDRRARHLLQWVSSLILQPSVCEMCYLDGLKTLSAAHVYVTSSPAPLALWDASTSPHTRRWMRFTNQSQAGGEEHHPEESTADIPKAKQQQRSVPLLPRPCWSRRTHWLMIRVGKHTERPAGSLEDQFITLYFVWPSRATPPPHSFRG